MALRAKLIHLIYVELWKGADSTQKKMMEGYEG
jgi:hypothetical protein